MKWWPSECQPGDMIRIQIGQIYHYGIFVSENEVIQFGEPPTDGLFRRDSDSVRVCVTTAEAFACGRIVETAQPDRKEKRARIKPAETVRIARSRVGEGGYNLIHNNCEHFAYECVFGVKRSTQEEEARKMWQERPVLNVFLLPRTTLQTETVTFPPEIDTYLSRIRNPEKKSRGIALYTLLAFAVKQTYNRSLTDYAFRRKPFARPQCDEFHYVLTTASEGAYLAAAVSGTPLSLRTDGRNPGGTEKLGKGILHVEKPFSLTIRNRRADCPVIYLCDGMGGKTVLNQSYEGMK